MKKIIISGLILIILATGILFGTISWKDKDNDDNSLTKVTVAEPTLT